MTRSFANTYCFFELFHFSFSWKFHQIFVIWELIVDKKGGRSAGTPWPRCSWKWVTHKTFPNSNLDKYLQIQISLLCSVQHIEAREDSDVSLRRRRNGSKEEEGGGGHGERPETAKVSSKGNLDPCCTHEMIFRWVLTGQAASTGVSGEVQRSVLLQGSSWVSSPCPEYALRWTKGVTSPRVL